VLLVIVVVFLGVVIPLFDRKISKIEDALDTLEYDREMRFMNLQWFLLHDSKETQRTTQIYLLKLLQDETGIQSTEMLRKKEAKKSLSKLHSALTGEIASTELKAKWDKMDSQQVKNEVERLVEMEDFTELYENIKNKKTEHAKAEVLRTRVLVLTTILQVIGLLMINVHEYFRGYAKDRQTKVELKKRRKKGRNKGVR
jgi:hypothetical protein